MRRRREGTASVEIVVMLPFFVLLWASISYLHEAASAALTVRERVRGCAWEVAVNGCTDEAASGPLCREVIIEKRERGEDRRNLPEVFEQVTDIPVIGKYVESLFGEDVEVRSEQSTRGLSNMGGQLMIGRYAMVCNTVPKRGEELLEEQVCGVVKDRLHIPGWLVGCK